MLHGLVLLAGEISKEGQEWNDYTPFIVVGSTLLGMVISYLTFVRSRDAGIQKDARESERINENLKSIRLSQERSEENQNKLEKIQRDGTKEFYEIQRDIVVLKSVVDNLLSRYNREHNSPNIKSINERRQEKNRGDKNDE